MLNNLTMSQWLLNIWNLYQAKTHPGFKSTQNSMVLWLRLNFSSRMVWKVQLFKLKLIIVLKPHMHRHGIFQSRSGRSKSSCTITGMWMAWNFLTRKTMRYTNGEKKTPALGQTKKSARASRSLVHTVTQQKSIVPFNLGSSYGIQSHPKTLETTPFT